MWWLHREIGKAHMPSRTVLQNPQPLSYCMAKPTVNPLRGSLPDRRCAVLMVWRALRAESGQKAVASKGVCAVHSRHSFLSSPRDLKQNWFLSPPPTTRFLSYMCALLHKGVCTLNHWWCVPDTTSQHHLWSAVVPVPRGGERLTWLCWYGKRLNRAEGLTSMASNIASPMRDLMH